jgi:hypothetical protein
VSVEFGDVLVGQIHTRQLTVSNAGTAALQVLQLVPNSAAFTVVPSVGFRLQPGEQRIVQVQLDASGTGQINSSITVRSDDPRNPDLVVPLTANVTPVAPTPNPQPIVSSLSPTSAEAAGARFSLVVNGGNFVSSSVVEWNGQPRTTFFNHAGQLIATITAADILAAGTARISVFTPPPGGGRSNVLDFMVTPAQAEGPRVLINQFDVRACPEITSYISVLDSGGLPVAGITPENLSCTVDGTPVSCTLAPETELPWSIVLVPGINGLTRDEDITLLKNALRSFVNGLPDNTRISLIHLEDVARSLVAFTEDKDRILPVLDQLRAVPPGNALYDAVTFALIQLRTEQRRRVAVVLISALDNLSGNERNPISPLGNARIDGVPFFSFAVGPGSTDVNLTGFLRELSRTTGGQLVAQASPREYGRMLNALNQILLGQYRAQHTGLALDSRTRTLRLTVQTPSGAATGSRSYACRP